MTRRPLKRSTFWNSRRDALPFRLLLFAHVSAAALGTPVFQWQRCPASYCETGWLRSVFGSSEMRTVAVADLDGDGSNEIVVVGSFYDCRTGESQQPFQVPMVFNADRMRGATGGGFDGTALSVPDGNAAPLSSQPLRSARARRRSRA